MVSVLEKPPRARKSAPAPIIIGPTWQRNRRGFVLPERTLGWEIIGWCAKWLLIPDGPQAGEPWKFTDEQARFLLHWYAVDAQGRFIHRRGVLRRMKGWGKDPFAAVLAAVEFVGPCRYAGSVGKEPIAAEHPAGWVQVAAVALDQTRTTMTLFPGVFSKRAVEEFEIDLGKEIIYGHRGRARIEALTTSSRAQEGPRPTFAIANETHHWMVANEGHSMRATIARNLAKTGGRMLGITNAHNPGEDSIGEQDYEAHLKIAAGVSSASGLLYDSLEAPAETDMADPKSLRAGLLAARGDSTWLDVDRLMEEIYDPMTPASMSRRFYLNQVVAGEDAWLSSQEWDAVAEPEHELPPRAQVTLGFDGSKSDDHTALVACEVETGYLFTLAVWDPTKEPDGLIDRAKVDAAVKSAFETYDVVGFYSDVSPWESYIDAWSQEYGEQLCARATARHPVGWDMRARQQDITRASEAFKAAVLDGDLPHEVSDTSRWYVLNARARVNGHGITFSKESQNSQRKVDWLAAALLAHLARQDYIALPDNKKRLNTRSVYEDRGVRRL